MSAAQPQGLAVSGFHPAACRSGGQMWLQCLVKQMPNSRPPPQAHTPADDITGSILTQKSINMQKQVSSNPNPLLESIRLISQSGNYKLEAERQGGARIPDSDFLGQLLPRVQDSRCRQNKSRENSLLWVPLFFPLRNSDTCFGFVVAVVLWCSTGKPQIKVFLSQSRRRKTRYSWLERCHFSSTKQLMPVSPS